MVKNHICFDYFKCIFALTEKIIKFNIRIQIKFIMFTLVLSRNTLITYYVKFVKNHKQFKPNLKMNKLNLIIGSLIGLLIISCSSDNDNNEINNVQDSTKQLSRIESTSFFEDEKYSETLIRYFENGKLMVDSTWNKDGQFTGKTNYTYNTNGVIIKEELKSNRSGLTAEWNYTYDNLGRLSKYQSIENDPISGNFESNIEYNYISDTLVEQKFVRSGYVNKLNFSVEGLLISTKNTKYTYKSNNDLESIDYGEENQPVTVIYSQTDVLGGFSRLETFFNGNIMNFHLDAGEIPYAGESYFGAKKLISSRIHGNSSVDYEHTLDDEGYLIEEVQISNNYNDEIYTTKYFYN